VIADEPTAHLDQQNVEATLRLLRRLTDEGRIVVVSTHDTRLVPLAEQTIDLAPSTQPTGAPPGFIELEDGQHLFHEGDGSDWIYFVVTGTIDLVQHDMTVASAGVGDWFGEMGPLFSLPRSATARASGRTVVEPVSVGEFRARLGLATLRDLLDRRRATN
jgi:putative ABC transport system ATP-binding protein